VQQWEGLIAVNYAARAAGITRHMKAPEALVKCPGLQLVHVQTLGAGVPDADGASTEVAPSEDTPARGGEGDQGAAGGIEQQAGSRDREKACLERYRQASGKIIGLLRDKAPQVCLLCQRAVHAVLAMLRNKDLSCGAVFHSRLAAFYLIANNRHGSCVLPDGTLFSKPLPCVTLRSMCVYSRHPLVLSVQFACVLVC